MFFPRNGGTEMAETLAPWLVKSLVSCRSSPMPLRVYFVYFLVYFRRIPMIQTGPLVWLPIPRIGWRDSLIGNFHSLRTMGENPWIFPSTIRPIRFASAGPLSISELLEYQAAVSSHGHADDLRAAHFSSGKSAMPQRIVGYSLVLLKSCSVSYRYTLNCY